MLVEAVVAKTFFLLDIVLVAGTMRRAVEMAVVESEKKSLVSGKVR